MKPKNPNKIYRILTPIFGIIGSLPGIVLMGYGFSINRVNHKVLFIAFASLISLCTSILAGFNCLSKRTVGTVLVLLATVIPVVILACSVSDPPRLRVEDLPYYVLFLLIPLSLMAAGLIALRVAKKEAAGSAREVIE